MLRVGLLIDKNAKHGHAQQMFMRPLMHKKMKDRQYGWRVHGQVYVTAIY